MICTYFLVNKEHVILKTFLEWIRYATYFADKLLFGRVYSHVIFQTFLTHERHFTDGASNFFLVRRFDVLLVVVRAFNLDQAKLAVNNGSVTGDVFFEESLCFVRFSAQFTRKGSLV